MHGKVAGPGLDGLQLGWQQAGHSPHLQVVADGAQSFPVCNPVTSSTRFNRHPSRQKQPSDFVGLQLTVYDAAEDVTLVIKFTKPYLLLHEDTVA